jgi:ankyrin repeat protein
MIPLHCHQRCIKEVIRSLPYNIVSLILLPVNFSALRSYIVQSHLSPNVENAYICSMACDHKGDGSLKRMRLDLVRALIEQKADMFAKDNFGRTPLMYAYISGDRQMMHMLAMNCDNGWIDAPIHDPRVRMDSVIVRSNICMHFQHWETDDFAQYKSTY